MFIKNLNLKITKKKQAFLVTISLLFLLAVALTVYWLVIKQNWLNKPDLDQYLDEISQVANDLNCQQILLENQIDKKIELLNQKYQITQEIQFTLDKLTIPLSVVTENQWQKIKKTHSSTLSSQEFTQQYQDIAAKLATKVSNCLQSIIRKSQSIRRLIF